MAETIQWETENDEGVEEVLEIPAKYEVCSTCSGKGTRVNPSIDGHGISREEFDEDPDFEEDYRRGVYDVTCSECDGVRVQLTPDWDAKWPAGLKERYEEHLRGEAAYAAERRSEERFGY